MFENLGTKLKNLREQNGYSRKQIAELLDISPAAIGFYETGERLPSLSVLTKLCAYYKTSADYLLDINHSTADAISSDGLNSQQITVIKDIIKCFRNL